MEEKRYTHNSKQKNLSEIKQPTAVRRGEDLMVHGQDRLAMPEVLVSPRYQLRESLGGKRQNQTTNAPRKRGSPKRQSTKERAQIGLAPTLKERQTMEMVRSLPARRKRSPKKRAGYIVDTDAEKEHSADEAIVQKLPEVTDDSVVPAEHEDLSQVNIPSLSTMIANDMSVEALAALHNCLDRQQRGSGVGGLGGDLENTDTREYLRRTNKLVKALQFTTNRLVLSQDNFHTELRLDSDHQVELVKDATFYFKVCLTDHNPPIKLHFEYFDLSTATVLRRNQIGNIIQVFASQTNPKPKANSCQAQSISPTTVEINGAHNAGDKTKFENPEAFLAVHCFGAKSEDILLKIRLRAQAEMSLGQARQ